ncbi:beta-ketoacyl-ACP synthase III [Brumimicrobium aurantiacum]|uniref:StlD/DarB family beta-ketosynthase n=1 Tax=Brumimicrobium aurantiacum TaxID=1737063 RepID=A0A3E1EZC3_9FLAO|nr:beta-ketoacyl-ACP synthase III [Brumimicrobium aurantiacum]RFC54905.1 StlD/DarB family beta-ketosynthase [Brumimicrobium aurantiacum]
MSEVYITKASKYLPNSPISNDEMGEVLGFFNGSERVKNIVLRNNGILNRYYAIDKSKNITHSNAELTYKAIKGLLDSEFKIEDIELLSVGTSTPDQQLPSHAAMVHGLMKGSNRLEINSASGICTSGMNALKYAFMAIKSGMVNNAVAGGSERVSPMLSLGNFNYEMDTAAKIEENPVLAFEKEFLRWMLSDGSGTFLLQNKPDPRNEVNLKIEWMDGQSFASELETCMYSGAEKAENGDLISWMNFSSSEWAERSIFSIRQDIKLLDEQIIKNGVESLKNVLNRHEFEASEIDYFLPHISSFFFKEKLMEGIRAEGLDIPDDKLFINLDQIGNVGSASIYLMLEELMYSKRLVKGDKILLSVPESGRFNYAYALISVE